MNTLPTENPVFHRGVSSPAKAQPALQTDASASVCEDVLQRLAGKEGEWRAKSRAAKADMAREVLKRVENLQVLRNLYPKIQPIFCHLGGGGPYHRERCKVLRLAYLLQ